MTTTKATALGHELTILKQDSQGRVRTPAARRESLLDEFERSGLSGPKFARLAGVKYQTFATWVQKRRRHPPCAPGVKPANPVQWIEAVVERAQNPAAIVVQLPGGVRLEVVDEKQAALAAALLRALAKPC